MLKKLLFLSTLFSSLQIFAQRTCGTMHHEQFLQQKDAKHSAFRQQIDQQVQSYLSNPANASGSRTIITIPVVVHVVYNTAAQNISLAQIQSQITSLNQDYSKSNTDWTNTPTAFQPLVANCQIQFCLAVRDPNGNTTTGVTRTSTTSTSFIDDDKVKYTAQGGADAWPAASYLNLWSCKLGNSLLGYAQFPGGPAATDGVVIGYSNFGNTGAAAAPFDKGRTATHEIGHWLNMRHIWGDDSGACTGSDLINDTPNQGSENFGCPTFPLTDACSPSSPGVMFMNYMDYVDDNCMVMFTNGQAAVMASLFATGGSRAPLLNSLGCVPVGNVAPTAFFTGTPTTICPGQTVTFTNQCTGSPTSYSWTFPGGTPATSTAANPTVTYAAAGTYDVTLSATNSYGTSTPLTKTAYISVATSTALPVVEGFENSVFPPTGWTLGNPDNNTAWVRTTNASGFGTSTASAFFDNYNANYVGQKDYLYTPNYNFSSVPNGRLKFDFAYSPFSTSNDTLQILYSTNCGATWTSLWKKGGNDLKTLATASGSLFVPSASQWKRDSVSLVSLSGQSSVQFAFVNICGYGNSLLLDNINIWNVTAATCTAPVANFLASPTTVTVGSTVNFTDNSTNTPTSWAWTFTGASTTSSTVQNPTNILYNTIGTYPVTLLATNSCGNNTITKMAYINVIAASTSTSCDTLSLIGANDSARIYYATSSATGGFVSGSNTFGDLAKANKFTITSGKKVSGVRLAFGISKYANTTDFVTVKVWDNSGTGGTPGAVLASKTVTLASIAANINSSPYQMTDVTFTTPANNGGTFYVGFQMKYATGDTVAVYNTSVFNGANHHLQGWEMLSDSTWHSYDSSWNASLANYIFPFVCATPAPVAGFKTNTTSVCAGNSITFSDTSLYTPTSWSWTFPGGTPAVSSAQNPVVTYAAAGTYNVSLSVSNALGSNAITKTNYITIKANPTTSTSATPVACFGASTGGATVTPTGGASPYTYLWSGGESTATISNKPAGNYTVTVTSAGSCTVTATANISQPFNAISATLTPHTAFCGNSNGSASVTATGGSGSFTYLWSNSATSSTISNLATGGYSVTVKDVNNCSLVLTTTIPNQSNTMTVALTPVNPSCGLNNGSISAVASGTVSKTYLWSNSATTSSISSLPAGTYTVTVTDANGCSTTASSTLTNIAAPTATITKTNSSCVGVNNGTASVTVSGTGTYTYSWSNSATTSSISNLAPGTYSVTASSGGCSATATTTIAAGASPVATLFPTSVNCNNGGNGKDSVSVSGATGAVTYHWNTNATANVISNVGTGSYSVTITDANTCTASATNTLSYGTSPLIVTITSTNTSCATANNGSAVASITNTTPFTYSWSNSGTTASISNLAPTIYSVTVTNGAGCSASASTTISAGVSPNLTISNTNASCPGVNNGTANAVLSGTGTKTYLWSNSAATANLTNLASGTYSVTASIAGCSATASTTISVGASPTATLFPTNVNCNNGADGKDSVSVSGATGAVTYHWASGATTNSLTNLAPGTYSVTIFDANTCSATASNSIAYGTTPLLVTITPTNTTCSTVNNGSAVASITNTTPFTYTWSNSANTASITNLAPANYSVTVTNGSGCSASATTTIAAGSGPTATIATNNVKCKGGANGSATISVSGTAASTYNWSNSSTSGNPTNLSAGAYTVTITQAGCQIVKSCTITEPSTSLTGSGTTTASSGASNANGTATVVAAGGTASYTYAWSNGATTAHVTGLLKGSYTCTITDANGCSVTVPIAVESTNGIQDISPVEFSLSPNPASNLITISAKLSESNFVSIEIINLLGEKVMLLDLGKTQNLQQPISIENLAAGSYILKIKAGNQFSMKQFIKN